MEHLREFKEEVEIVEEESLEVHTKVILSDPTAPTSDVLIRSRSRSKVRETGATINASLGAMRPLVGKLDMLLLRDAPLKCCSKRIKDRMHLLKDDVEKISSYLDELSEVEDPPPMAMCWMNEARDLSYDMEDYVDSLLFVPPEDPSLVADSIKATRSLCKWFSHVKTSQTQVISAETLSEFRMYVQEAIQRYQRYNLHSCRTLRRRFVSFGPMVLPRPYEETADIVIDGKMNEFINSLANDGDQQLKVLSVLGSACLGKTTLARVLYRRFKNQYSCRAFIRVSKKPDMKRIFCDMLSQLQRQHPPQHCREIDLIHDIKQYLQDKRYLIIIDDVWAASVWDIINHVFPKGNHGSRIIITTQIEDVALTCCCYQSEYVFEMKHLDDDHSRKLFLNRMFGSERDCPEQFRDILNEIVETCDGLPLTTVSIASLLASQPVMSIDLFTYIHRSLSSCFSASEKTRQALNLSFNNLPHYLKTCLMYLIMYPEGYIFCKDDLMKQLVAEGFIDTVEGQDILKVAEIYLDQLIGRRFIQPICVNYNNEVLSCAVHDVVHDLIAHKSAEENFIVKIDQSRTNVPLSHKVRRLSLLFGNARYAKTPVNIRKSQVRSLTLFGSFECIPCIREFKLLRVLNLQLSCHGGDDGPIDLTGISELYQLRYLKIASDVCIKLPNHGLQCLETLDIMDTKIAYAPWNIQLPHLLHLSLPVEQKLLDCFVSLGRLGKLNNLQDLHLTIPSTRFHVVQRSMDALGCLIGGHVNLKTIQVVAHGSSSTNALVRGASEVTISWYDLAPPPFLQRFECSLRSCIIFYNVPMWVGKLDSLCILKISVRELMMDCVDILRGLPALTALSLYVQRAPIERIIFDKAGFLVLEYFKLRLTSGIAWLKFEKDAMPNLLKLKLVFNAIPPLDQHLYSSDEGTFKQRQLGTAVISIEHMPGLKEISVKIGGAAAYLEYASRTFVSNHPSNPTVNMQLVDHSSSGDESTKQKQQPDEYYTQLPDKILEEEPDEYAKTSERPAYKRISWSAGPYSPLHVPAVVPVGTSEIGSEPDAEIPVAPTTNDNMMLPMNLEAFARENYPSTNLESSIKEMESLVGTEDQQMEDGTQKKQSKEEADEESSIHSPRRGSHAPLRQMKKLGKLTLPSHESTMGKFLTQSTMFKDVDLLINKDGLLIIPQSNEVETTPIKPLDNNQLSIDDLEAIKVIGKGCSGTVQLVRHKWTGQLFALKVVSLNIQESIRKQLAQELKISLSTQCQYVVTCHQCFYVNGVISIALEYMDGGSLADFLKAVRTVPEPYLAAICKQVLKGLLYLHNEKRVIHRDLKPSNILINHRGEVKISDFGVSAIISSSSAQRDTFTGTFNYMAVGERLFKLCKHAIQWREKMSHHFLFQLTNVACILLSLDSQKESVGRNMVI